MREGEELTDGPERPPSVGAGSKAGQGPGPRTAPPDANHYWQYCVNCGTKLEGRKCKLICPTCGFFHSCSEP